jgi:cytochrome b subunit of formate dehydrogenase
MSSTDARDSALRVERSEVSARPGYYSRFTLAQRYLHGVIMATFIGLAFTGMVLRFSHSGWAHSIALGVGGFSAILFWHKFCAVILTLAFLAHLGDVGYRGIFKRQYGIFWGPYSMIPRWKDVQDLVGHFRWFLWLGPRPKFDHFAYWEKFDYWAVFWGMGIIGFSGYAMWFAPFFARFIPGSWLNIALLIHGEEALLAVWFIFAIHFFNTHLRPDSFPMDLVIFTGRVSEAELKEKHPAEYQRLVESGRLQAYLAPAPQHWLKNFGYIVGVVVVLSGFVLLVLTLVTYFRGG